MAQQPLDVVSLDDQCTQLEPPVVLQPLLGVAQLGQISTSIWNVRRINSAYGRYLDGAMRWRLLAVRMGGVRLGLR